jgi:hypothetical protein
MFTTAPVLNKGTDCRLVQPVNILDMLLTTIVLNKGTDCRLEQLLNIADIPTVPLVLILNRGTV